MRGKRTVFVIFMMVWAAQAFPGQRSTNDSDEDSSSSSSEEDSSFEKKTRSYNSKLRPRVSSNSNNSVNVEVNMYVRDVVEIDNFKQEVKLQLTFRQEWKDISLIFKGKNENEYITLTNPNKIWTPDTFIGNEREGAHHTLLTPNFLMRLYPSGKVLYSTRLTAVVKCLMDFHDYPFDRQECYATFASYGYTTKDVTYSWRAEEPVQVSQNPHSPPFELEHYYTGNCGPAITKTGNYDCLKVSFIFKRNSSSILIKTYLPTAVFVVLSMISFWMGAKFIGARCLVLVSSLVSCTLIYYFILEALPPVSYTRSVDRWMWTCVAFIFAAVVEFLIVVSLTKKQEDHKNDKIEPFTIATPGEKEKKIVILNLKDYMTSWTPGSWSLFVDKISRVMFPAGFIIFLIIYFVQEKVAFETI